MGHQYYCIMYVYYVRRYQPGSLNFSAEKKPVELQTLTDKKNVSEMGKQPYNETFSPRHLLLPSSESPTETSGLIVYVTTAVTCKISFTDKLSFSIQQLFFQINHFPVKFFNSLQGILTLTLSFVTQGSQGPQNIRLFHRNCKRGFKIQLKTSDMITTKYKYIVLTKQQESNLSRHFWTRSK